MSVADAERRVAAALQAAGCPDPERDATLLLADAAAAQDRPQPMTHLSASASDALALTMARRVQREPLGYIRGRVTFRGLEILVDRRVFIPRAETEMLVEAALAIPYGARVLEACTGSGAVALALKHEREDLDITASDASREALDLASVNAARLDLDLSLIHATDIAGVPDGPYDAVVSNPPYVAHAEAGAGSLPPELEHHEPSDAFWAGHDGLLLYRRLTAELHEVGWVAFEVGDGQARAVAAMLQKVGFERPEAHSVPSGQVRVVTAERPRIEERRVRAGQ